MSERTVEAIRVTKTFGEMTAVREVSLSIAAGEFFSLLGPSGCGKTTLLRMIAGFETPTAGQIIVAGRDMASVPPHRRPVNMVFQNYALFPHLTVFENVAFGLKSSGQVPAADIAARVRQALELVRLKEFGDRYPREISGGQQQRVALARAIVNRPAVLLLDEPLSALDLKIRQEMQEELARLQRELGITFVMVTHDQGEALALSNRLAVFYHGNLEQIGSPQEIYEQPQTRFVADFIGQTNLLEGRLLESLGEFALVEIEAVAAQSSSQKLILCLRSIPGLDVDSRQQAVTVWVRTQSLRLSSREGGGAPFGFDLDKWRAQAATGRIPENGLPAVVTDRSYQGDSTDYRLELDNGLTLRACSPNHGGPAFSPGDAVTVTISANQVSILGGRQPTGDNTGTAGSSEEASGLSSGEDCRIEGSPGSGRPVQGAADQLSGPGSQ